VSSGSAGSLPEANALLNHCPAQRAAEICSERRLATVTGGDAALGEPLVSDSAWA
jgi:hypothetical protein